MVFQSIDGQLTDVKDKKSPRLAASSILVARCPSAVLVAFDFVAPLFWKQTGSILPFGHAGHELCGLQVGKTIFDQFWSKPHQWHLADRALCESTRQVSGSSPCLQGYERFVPRSLCGNLYGLEKDGLRKWGGLELRVSAFERLKRWKKCGCAQHCCHCCRVFHVQYLFGSNSVQQQ